MPQLTERVKSSQINQATIVLNQQVRFEVFRAWRCWSLKVTDLRTKHKTRLLTTALKGWNEWTGKSLWLSEKTALISEKACRRRIATFYYKWLDAYNERVAARQADRHRRLKAIQKIFVAWNAFAC